MQLLDLFSYFITLAAIALAPGPMLLLLMTRAASDDVAGALGFALGAALGSLSIVTAVCFGMNAWLDAAPQALSFSKYLMLAYIAWIAWGMWRGGFDMSAPVPQTRGGLWLSIVVGYTTCILSPYMLVLFPLILPEMLQISQITMPNFLIIASTTFLAEAAAAVLVVGLAAQLRHLVRSQKSCRLMNRALAAVLMAGGGWMALS